MEREGSYPDKTTYLEAIREDFVYKWKKSETRPAAEVEKSCNDILMGIACQHNWWKGWRSVQINGRPEVEGNWKWWTEKCLSNIS